MPFTSLPCSRICVHPFWFALLFLGAANTSMAETEHRVIILPGQEAIIQECLELQVAGPSQLRFTGAHILQDKVHALYENAEPAILISVTLVYPGQAPTAAGELATGLRIEDISGADEATAHALRKSLMVALKDLVGVFRWSRVGGGGVSQKTANTPRQRILDLIEKAEADLAAKSPDSFAQTLEEIRSAQKEMSKVRDTIWVSLQVGRLLDEAGEEARTKDLFLALGAQIDEKIRRAENTDPAALARLQIFKARTLVGLQRDDKALTITLSVLEKNSDDDVICSCVQVAGDFLKRRQFTPAHIIVTNIKGKGVSCARMATLETALTDLQKATLDDHHKDTAAANTDTTPDAGGDKSSAPIWMILMLCALAGLIFFKASKARKGSSSTSPEK